MTGREPFPFGKYKGTAIKDIPEDYRKWCLAQDWFEERSSNQAIADYWGMQSSDPDAVEVVMATKTEARNINTEKDLLTMAPPGFQVWWFKAFGNRLLKDGEQLYIPYLRVALDAWRAALTPVGGVATPEQIAAVTTPKPANDVRTPPSKPLPQDNRDEEINF